MNRLMLFGAGTVVGAAAFLEMRQGLPVRMAGLDEEMDVLGQNTNDKLVGSLKGISISPDNRRAVVFSQPTGYAAYGDTYDFSAREGAVSISDVCAAFALDDCYIVCGDAPYLIVKEWDGGNLRSYDTTGLGRVACACLSHDKTKLFLTHSLSKMRVYDLQTGNFVEAEVGSYDFAYNQHYQILCATRSGEFVFSARRYYWNNFQQHICDASTLEVVQTPPDNGELYTLQAIAHPHEADSIIISLGTRKSTSGALMVVNCSDGTTRYALNEAAFGQYFPGKPSLQLSHIVYDEVYDEIYAIAQNGTDIKLLALDAHTLTPVREMFLLEEGVKARKIINSCLQALAIIRRDNCQITGTVRASNNAPAARVVRAYRRSDGALMAQTVSDQATGNYRLALPEPAVYDVQFQALDSEELNDLFFARATPEPLGA